MGTPLTNPMEALVTPKDQPDHKLPDLVKSLNSSLSVIKPNNSETAQLITYALLATVVVGIAVYHYIRENEQVEDLKATIKK